MPGAGANTLNLLVQFSYLQVLDILSTMAFLMQGVQEANPVVRLAMRLGDSPLTGLVLMKAFAIGLAIYCLRRARHRLLARVNIFFAALVAWNLVVVVFAR